jgi:hypothetical protein
MAEKALCFFWRRIFLPVRVALFSCFFFCLLSRRARGPVELAKVWPVSGALSLILGLSGTLRGGAAEGSFVVLDTLRDGAEVGFVLGFVALRVVGPAEGALVGRRALERLARDGAAMGALVGFLNRGLRRGGLLVRTVSSSEEMSIGGLVVGRSDGVCVVGGSLGGPGAGGEVGVAVVVGIGGRASGSGLGVGDGSVATSGDWSSTGTGLGVSDGAVATSGDCWSVGTGLGGKDGSVERSMIGASMGVVLG